MHTWIRLWKTGKIFNQAFRDQRQVIDEVYALLDTVLQSPKDTPAFYRVNMGTVPESFYELRRNLFSTLFISIYQLLDISPEKRLLYGKLNQLFRIWVTSADNLLDQEEKLTVPINMCGQSHVMHQVIAIMAADRALQKILADAVSESVITTQQAQQLTDETLQILLPSAAQEASEERGITERPEPEHVFETIHRFKTGLLFHIPFLGPEVVDSGIDNALFAKLKDALMQFGLGCQLVDDIRDLARDYKEQRHNYMLSLLYHEHPVSYQQLASQEIHIEDRLYKSFPELTQTVAQRGLKHMYDGLKSLGETDLHFSAKTAERLARAMFKVLDVSELRHVKL